MIKEETISYGDYRTVDDVKLPYRIESSRGDDTDQIAVTRSQVNGILAERGDEVSTLVEKDGEPLSEEEQKKGAKEEKDKDRARKRGTTIIQGSKCSCEPASLRIPAASASSARTCWFLILSRIPSSTRTSSKRRAAFAIARASPNRVI